MIKTTTTISNKLGLHARASAKLTKLAGSFPCEVWMSRGERRVNAKSIMGVMMLAAGIGTEVSLETHGQREHPDIDIRIDASDVSVDLETSDVDLALRYTLPGPGTQGGLRLFGEQLAVVAHPRGFAAHQRHP